jgi:hypothetical protein
MSASLHIRFHGKDRFHTDRRSVPAQPDYFKAGEDLQEGEEFEGKAAIARSDAQEERKDNGTDSRRAPRPDRYCPCMAEEAPGWGLEEAPRWAPFRQTVEAQRGETEGAQARPDQGSKGQRFRRSILDHENGPRACEEEV